MTDETDRTDDEREFAAVSEKDIWEEARDRLKICTDSESDNRKRAKECNPTCGRCVFIIASKQD